ncbi:T-cell surface glycoprotein CD3 epsilon chain-like [Brachyhypopomus gauderio]|uniref:T-cell surface glycoprotein CD3 epsilon chain-like n=1 Tax=Brachyhypopomus gauderio TaxID=698409 RepID=UPI004042F6E5
MRPCGMIWMFLTFTVIGSEEVEGTVYVSGTTVTLQCPFEPTSWKILDKTEDKKNQTYTIENYNEENDGQYSCKQIQDTILEYYFFTKVKVCENCVELDTSLASGIIIGDMLLTLGVSLIVYLYARMKSGPAAPQRAAHIRQTGAPTPPDPDYQMLNPATRSTDVYADARKK